jgi:hypothetical protein
MKVFLYEDDDCNKAIIIARDEEEAMTIAKLKFQKKMLGQRRVEPLSLDKISCYAIDES